ncbi:MAG: hypothetical protein Tsb002_34290 [Wenzhouxiangellaceae bacterium]
MNDNLGKIAEKLTTILDAWECGAQNVQYVHEESEALLALIDWQKYPRDSEDSVILEVVAQLDILNQQLIIHSDIPAIKQFLNEGRLNPLLAWSNWEKYWNNVDYEKRKAMLRNHTYYCT